MDLAQFAVAKDLEQRRAVLLQQKQWFEQKGCQVVCPVSETTKLVLSMSPQVRDMLNTGIADYFNEQIAALNAELIKLGVEV